MSRPASIAYKTPELFIAEDLSSDRARELFLKFSTTKQAVKIQGFLLGHNTECFAPEPVYGPTGKGRLKSRGVEGLNRDREIMMHFASAAGIADVKDFLNKVIESLKEEMSYEHNAERFPELVLAGS